MLGFLFYYFIGFAADRSFCYGGKIQHNLRDFMVFGHNDHHRKHSYGKPKFCHSFLGAFFGK